MAQALNFAVDDTSPTISYLPFTDSFPPNLTAGWNSFFEGSGFPKSVGEFGNGTSFHVTSFDQATISITWRGTGIQVLGRVQGNASYSITLDGALKTSNPNNETLAVFQDLMDQVHTLLLSTAIPFVIGGNQPEFFFDKAVIYFNTSSSPSSNLVALKNVLFQGSWDLQNINNTMFHKSQTKGDFVRSTFAEGASFLLSGGTSPTAGRYSVIVDNNNTFNLSGKSTFTNPDTILFYVTGLDPTMTHDVQITNEDDHDLLLKSDGFQAFELASAQPTSSLPPESGVAMSKGTIAALVLAGILGFLIISGLLYFFLVIRPQKRKMLARKTRRRKKEKEAGPLGVLNIAPTVFPDDTEIGSQEGTTGHHKKHSSEKSGFARWKREVEGGFENILGITFRHSGSTGKKSRKSGISGGPSSAKSSVFTLSSLFTLSSSRRSHGKGKRKAKSKQVSESSQSTDIALEFPVSPDSPDSFKEKDAELTRLSPVPHVSESEMHTLSYMNTPSVRPASASSPPILSHSQSRTDITSPSTHQPIPRPPSRGHSLHASESSGRQGSVGFLLNYGDPQTGSHEDVGDSVGSMPPPFDPGHLSVLPPRERGSARYSSDDTTSYYLGSAATRLAIRSLRPRTTQSPDVQSLERTEGKARASDKTHEPDDPANHSARSPPSPPNSDTSFLYVVTPAIRPIDIPPTEIPQIEIPPAGIPELPHKILLDISPSSPFRVDFPSNSSCASSHLELPVITRPPESNFEQNTDTLLRSVSRLAPPSNPPLSSNGRNSFLDFGTPLNMPHHQSPPSENSIQKQESERSRRSTSTFQTASLSRSGSSKVSAPVTSPTSGPTSYFPYPVSLTPSPYHPEGHIPARPVQSRSTIANNEAQRVDRRLAQLRLSAFGPPTEDSVPISVTSEKPRHSGSTSDFGEGANSSQLLPHPPLPHKHSNASFPPL